jgi:hypothetical protein
MQFAQKYVNFLQSWLILFRFEDVQGNEYQS